MLMNPTVWGDPETFRPERFLEADADTRPNPLVVVFGYGARSVTQCTRLVLGLKPL